MHTKKLGDHFIDLKKFRFNIIYCRTLLNTTNKLFLAFKPCSDNAFTTGITFPVVL